MLSLGGGVSRHSPEDCCGHIVSWQPGFWLGKHAGQKPGRTGTAQEGTLAAAGVLVYSKRLLFREAADGRRSEHACHLSCTMSV